MNGNSKAHPRLNIPLISEALLELRYPKSNELLYGLIPGQLYEALKGIFPKPQELPLAQLPIDGLPDHLVRHRFLTEDDSRMFQVGVGVLSINHVKYTGFTDFVQDCKDVLSAAETMGLFSQVDRIGLRYINTSVLDRPWNEIIQIKVNVPSTIESNLQGQQFRWFTKFPKLGLLSTTVAWPVESSQVISNAKLHQQQTLLIDFDLFNEPQEKLSYDSLMDWLYRSHDVIYEVFKSSLKAKYFKYLKEG